MITADQAIATAQQWEAEKAAGPSALVGRALLAHINSLASLADQEVIRALEAAAVICDQTYVEPGDIKIENCHEAAAKIRSLKIEKARLASPQVTDEQILALARQYGCSVGDCFAFARALLSAPPAAEMQLTDTFVQTVPDKCDRILWRGGYHHLPIAAAPEEAKPKSFLAQWTDVIMDGNQKAKPVAADGCQLVPKVATSEMLSAFYAEPSLAEGWAAALAAAPQEQAPVDYKGPKGWRFVEKKTCYQIHDGHNCIANLVGPDAEENAKIIARILATAITGDKNV